MNVNKNYVIKDPFAVFYNEGHWRISTVSPLYNLQSNTVKHKQYASKIRQAIVSSVSSNPAIKYAVVVEPQPNLKYSEDDPESFSVTVTLSQRNECKVIYMCIIMSWGMSFKVKHAIHLPFMLEHGEQRIGSPVRATLQDMFDCTIKQFYFTQYQLLQFAINFIENDTSRSTDPFTFCYKTEVDSKDKINLTFEIGDIRMILNGIKSNNSDKSNEVKLAYHLIQNQIFGTIMLDVTPLYLYEINLSKAEIKSNGIVKMKTPDIVKGVFTILNDIVNNHNL